MDVTENLSELNLLRTVESREVSLLDYLFHRFVYFGMCVAENVCPYTHPPDIGVPNAIEIPDMATRSPIEI